MIPEGHTIEDIKIREQIIRDFYREWKEKNPSQSPANRMKKASQTRCLTFTPYAWRSCIKMGI